MPTAPYAQVRASLNGGAVQTGGIAAAGGEVVQLSANPAGLVGATQYRWELISFPDDFAQPAGWSTDASGNYYSTAQTPPPFTLLLTAVDFGKYAIRLTLNGGGPAVTNRTPAAQREAIHALTDTATMIEVPSPTGLHDMAYYEEQQFSLRGWVQHYRQNLRALAARWTSLPGEGDVQGPGTSGNERLAVYDGASGKILKDGGVNPDELSLSVAKFGARPSASAAANVIALTAACAAAAAAGASLYWPAGEYDTNATIPLLHTVRHRGPGVIKRGSDLFDIEPRHGNTNKLYVATGGNNANDGLSSSQPRASIQGAFDAMVNYGPVLGGTWRVEVAAGTYTNQPVAVEGLQSAVDIIVAGATVAMNATPTVRHDGTGSAALEGMSFSHNMRVKVENIRFQNWTVTDSAGLVARHRTQLWAYNVHANAVDESGLYAQGESRLYVQGGVFTNCSKGIRVAQGSTFTIGQGGDVVVCQDCEYGAHLRNQSGGVVINAEFRDCTVYGVQLLHSSEARFTNCLFEGNEVGLNVTGSAWYNDGNTFTGNTVDVETSQHSGELEESFEYFYDYANKRHGWGGGASRFDPGCKYHYRHAAVTGGAFHSGVQKGLEALNPVYGFLSDGVGAAFAGLYFAKPAATAIGQMVYRYDDNSLRLTVNSVASFRWGQTYYYPAVDNVVSLGLGAGAGRWTTVYATTGAINTSDEREKEQIEAIPDAVLDAWAEVDFVRYKWRDAVATKSSGARWHYGVIAQRVEAVFRRHGVDPFEHGLLCYDEWEAKDEVWKDHPEERDEKTDEVIKPAWRELLDPAVKAGNRYGLRYEEALILEAALMRRELKRLRTA